MKEQHNHRLQATRKSGAVSVFFLASGAPLLRSPEPKRCVFKREVLLVPSDTANLMTEIQNIISPFLVRRDYKLKNRTFSKHLDDGLIHLIEFGLARSTSSFYGKFTVDLGVFIPELYAIYEKKGIPKNITTQHCEFVRRLPSLEEGVEDKWWDVNEVSSSSNEVINLLQKYGYSFLEELTTREKIYQSWQKNGNSIGLPPPEAIGVRSTYLTEAIGVRSTYLTQYSIVKKQFH